MIAYDIDRRACNFTQITLHRSQQPERISLSKLGDSGHVCPRAGKRSRDYAKAVRFMSYFADKKFTLAAGELSAREGGKVTVSRLRPRDKSRGERDFYPESGGTCPGRINSRGRTRRAAPPDAPSIYSVHYARLINTNTHAVLTRSNLWMR